VNTGAGLWTVQKPGALAGQGKDTISGVEVLRFNDKSLWIADSFSFSDQSGALRLDLRAGAVSNMPVGRQEVAVSTAVDVLNANGGVGADVITGNALGNRIFGGSGNDSIDGGSGINYLRGDEGNDSMLGGAEFDDMHGNMGNDSLRGNGGDDWVVGGKDNDLLFGDAGFDIVYGNMGNDTVDGGTGNDWVRGGQGDDTVMGGSGDDWIWGDRGNDTISGGAGADLFYASSGGGVDRITYFNTAEGDRLQLRAGTQILYRNVTINGIANTEIFLGNGDNSFSAADELIARLQYTALAPGSDVFVVGNQTWTTYI
jgi:serralysin